MIKLPLDCDIANTNTDNANRTTNFIYLFLFQSASLNFTIYIKLPQIFKKDNLIISKKDKEKAIQICSI